ncbi:hypothetical protein Golob_027394 [Gossypium lobatum]|uniref:Uncharacterized protein n=1 Tax=Gossypium lobatum TaxID=34289 RepID=A0A7J8NJL0_9ROSI|nr:hypothetical protein [Gossypium lobatum]
MRLYDEIWETITVRGNEVRVTLREICEFYNVSYYAKALCRKAKILLEDHKEFMKPTKCMIGDSLYTQYVELQRKQITDWNQRTKHKMDEFRRQTNIREPNYLPNLNISDHSTLDSMRQGMKEEKNRTRLPRKIFKGMRMIMRQHSSRKIPDQRGPSYEAQPDMHLRRVEAPIKDMAREKEKYK